VSTFEPFNRQKACRYGQMLYNIHDIYIGRSLELYGEYSEGEVDLFRHFVQPGQVVVEAGANIGTHTVFLARQVGPRGTVLAFEPQRVIYQTLCANLALNSIPNAHCFKLALGASRGSVFVPPINYWTAGNFGGIPLGGDTEGESVSVVTLDSLNLTLCHFLKVDVEGMEEDVLRGAANLIARNRPVMYVENDKPEKTHALVRYIDSLEYLMYWHRPTYFNPRNFFGNPNNVFSYGFSANMICLPREHKYVVEGLERVEAPPIATKDTAGLATRYES
jgi:FkbM family methyltransferase